MCDWLAQDEGQVDRVHALGRMKGQFAMITRNWFWCNVVVLFERRIFEEI